MAAATTGKFLKRNPTVLQAIVDGLAAGIPKTVLAKTYHTSVESITAATSDKAVAETFERTASARLERIMAKQLERYQKAIEAEDGKVNVNSIPVHFGIFADKRAGLLNDTQSKPDESGQSVQSILDDLKGIQVNVQVNVTQPVDTKQVSVDVESKKV